MYGSTAFDDMVLGSTAGAETGVAGFATDYASRSPRMSASWTAASRMSKSAHDLVYETGSCRSGGWTVLITRLMSQYLHLYTFMELDAGGRRFVAYWRHIVAPQLGIWLYT